jgi:hypothetical protein
VRVEPVRNTRAEKKAPKGQSAEKGGASGPGWNILVLYEFGYARNAPPQSTCRNGPSFADGTTSIGSPQTVDGLGEEQMTDATANASYHQRATTRLTYASPLIIQGKHIRHCQKKKNVPASNCFGAPALLDSTPQQSLEYAEIECFGISDTPGMKTKQRRSLPVTSDELHRHSGSLPGLCSIACSSTLVRYL